MGRKSCFHENKDINGWVLIQFYMDIFHSSTKIKEIQSYEDLKGQENLHTKNLRLS